MTYLRIRNWEQYQHYKDRRPAWIKFYTSTLDDLDMRHLPMHTQLLWDRLLLIAARNANSIRNDPEAISGLTGIPCELVAEGIRDLVKGRWITETRSSRRASKPLAFRYQNAMPEVRSKSKKPPTPLNTNGTSPGGATWICPRCSGGLKFTSEARLAEHLEIVHWEAA